MKVGLKLFLSLLFGLSLQKRNVICAETKDKIDPCRNVRCPDGQCSVVIPLDGSPIPVCGGNPCVGYNGCCKKTTVGRVCEANGCYLEKVNSGPCGNNGRPCQVRPVCRNPCDVQQVKCDKPGESCYTSNAVCIDAPCNPIPECRKPCDTDNVNVCDSGLRCDRFYDCNRSDPRCKAKEVCVRTK